MLTIFLALLLGVASSPAQAQDARAQPDRAAVDVCIALDETRDTLSPQERTAAILLLARHFELAGRRVVADGCTIRYTVSHIRLGDLIAVTLSGGNESRQGVAVGLEDLPSLYNQMVRSIVTGRPMTGMNVVDRTNVTVSQASVNRVQSDRFGYARLGYAGLFGDRTYTMPSLGFGYRFELDSLGLDLSFLNLQHGGSSYQSSGHAIAGSWLKLQGLYFLRPTANASAYLGGGLSWGYSNVAGGSADGPHTYQTGWHGSGLQGELTFGYELPRASTLRLFMEVNGVLPFYRVTSETYSYSRSASTTTVDRRYAPSVVASVGVGWQRNREGRR